MTAQRTVTVSDDLLIAKISHGFDHLDAGDGRLTEHDHFPQLRRSDADTAFAHLDRDGDGAPSPEEFERAIVEYWTSRDPDAPGNWWAGGPQGTADRTAP